MLKYDKSDASLSRLHSSTMTELEILERQHLQSAIVASWDAFREELGMPELLLLGEEIEPHDSCRDRIDLLALDPTGSLVVIELKRGSDKRQLLQAIAYAGMISRWDKEELAARVPLDKCPEREDVKRLLQAGEIDFAAPRVILLAEVYEPEVILAADWLSGFNVPITAFGISMAKHDGQVLITISQRFPLPGLSDTYRSRGRATRPTTVIDQDWDSALGPDYPEVCKKALELFRTIKPGDPIRRRFCSMFSSGQFGGLQFNLTSKHVKVYARGQATDRQERLEQALGPGVQVGTWGNEQTNSGHTFVLTSVAELERFVAAAKVSGP